MTGTPCPEHLRAELRRGPQPVALTVDCPHCKAPAGQACTGPRNRALRQPHGSRWDAAGHPTRLETS